MRVFFSAGVLLLLAACVAPPKVQPTLRRDAPLAMGGTALPQTAWPAARWWQRYGDAQLSQLVDRAIVGSPLIASANARINAAREQVQLTGASQGAQVEVDAKFDRQRLSENGLLPTRFIGFNWYNLADLGIGVRYQLDWWGKQRASLEAALDRARSLMAEQRAAEIALSAAVAQEYFGWQADTARVALAQQRLSVLGEQRQLFERRIGAHLESVDLLNQLDQQQAAAAESVAALQLSQHLRLVALSALLASEEADLPMLALMPLPSPDAGLPPQVGINLLAHRPDITASRWRVEAAARETDVIRASYYPDISLHALAGLSSVELGKLLESSSATPRAGVALNLPLFDTGARAARHGVARAAVDQAVAEYNNTVISAARELGAAAQRAQTLSVQQTLRERSRQAAEALLVSARARMARGLTHRGPELIARSSWLVTLDDLLRIQHERIAADIQLSVALGGGYQEQELVSK